MKIQVTIGGTDYTAYYQPRSFQVDFQLAGTTRGKLALLIDPAPPSFEELGSIVEITDGDNFNELLFRGFLFRAKLRGVSDWEGSPKQGSSIECELVGFDSLADRFTVATKFEDIAVSEAVKQIIDNLTPMADEGVTYTAESIVDSPDLDMVRINYDPARKAFDELAKLFEWVWWIDYDRVFWFTPRLVRPAPFSFGGVGGASYHEISRDISLEGYANRLYLRAGQAETDEKQQRLSFRADEGDYQVLWPVADKPTLAEYNGNSLVRAIDPSRVGVRGVSDPELMNTADPTEPEFLYFYKINDDKISINSRYSPANNVDIIQVNYIGLYPINSRADNPEQQEQRKAAQEGGDVSENSSGIWEAVKDDRSINGIIFSAQRAEGLLGLVDQISDKLTITTPAFGFEPAMVVPVNAPLVFASGTYFVERAQVRDLGAIRAGPGTGPTRLETTLNLISTGAVVDFWDFWRRIEEAGRELVIRENETLNILQKDAVFIDAEDTPAVNQSDTTIPWDQDGYSVILTGLSTVGQIVRGLEEGP